MKTKVTINIMGQKVKEYETDREITLESIFNGVKNFKRDMDKLGIPCKVSASTNNKEEGK